MTVAWPEHGLERQRECPVCGESRRELLLDPPRHLVVFTPQALARALAAAGFRIVRRPAPAWSEFIYRISAHLAGRTGSALRHRPLATHVAARLRPATAEEIIVVAAPD